MKQYKILFTDIKQMRRFVSIVSDYPFRVNLYTAHYKIDAKSLMGVFSLDSTKPILLEAETDDVGDFEEKIRDYLAPEDKS
jgi:phosphocarrier protein HPr